MGIEPTGRKLDLRPNGFEDRERHQPAKHFPFMLVDELPEHLSSYPNIFRRVVKLWVPGGINYFIVVFCPIVFICPVRHL